MAADPRHGQQPERGQRVELSRRLNSSEVTIRRDLRELELAGKLKRTHGGAISIQQGNTSFEPHFAFLASENIASSSPSGSRRARDREQQPHHDRLGLHLPVACKSIRRCRDQPDGGDQFAARGDRAGRLRLCGAGAHRRPGAQNTLSSTATWPASCSARSRSTSLPRINGIDLNDHALTTPNLRIGGQARDDRLRAQNHHPGGPHQIQPQLFEPRGPDRRR